MTRATVVLCAALFLCLHHVSAKGGSLPIFKLTQAINSIKNNHPAEDFIIASESTSFVQQTYLVEFDGKEYVVGPDKITKAAEIIDCKKGVQSTKLKNSFYALVDGQKGQMFHFCANQITLQGVDWTTESQNCPHLDTCVRLPMNWAYPELNFTSNLWLNASYAVRVANHHKSQIRVKTLWSFYDKVVSDVAGVNDPVFDELQENIQLIACKPFDYNALLKAQTICAQYDECRDGRGNAVCGLFDSTFIELGGAFVVPRTLENEFFYMMYG